MSTLLSATITGQHAAWMAVGLLSRVSRCLYSSHARSMASASSPAPAPAGLPLLPFLLVATTLSSPQQTGNREAVEMVLARSASSSKLLARTRFFRCLLRPSFFSFSTAWATIDPFGFLVL